MLTCIQSAEHVVCSFVPLEHVLVDHGGIPSHPIHLLLEKEKVIMVITLITKIFLELCGIHQAADQVSVNWLRVSLVAGIVVVLTLDSFWRRAEGKDG